MLIFFVKFPNAGSLYFRNGIGLKALKRGGKYFFAINGKLFIKVCQLEITFTCFFQKLFIGEGVQCYIAVKRYKNDQFFKGKNISRP